MQFIQVTLFQKFIKYLFSIFLNNQKKDLKSTHASSSPVEITQSPNTTISKLKDENNHLILQLTYERSLRNKYEEESNRLHIIKIGLSLKFLKLNFCF